ncbi:MAG: GspH/FimT family pseudopilin [Xanthomonadaceae bacterium]|nr:GspH/FimT family pseudopilin [Xanthomonadaceae bacterium]
MQRSRGFTIMELLIGIAILAILTVVALPNFIAFTQNNRLAAQANELVATLQYARSEALKRGVDVQICSSASGTACDGDWNDGWVAVADPDATDPQLLRVWQSPGGDFSFDPPAGTVRFENDGVSSVDAEQTFRLQLASCTNDNARIIAIQNTGRVSAERAQCSG